jgi:hypothetical protein
VYDLQEPFRWIADAAVIKAFESGLLDLPDFYFTGDDYRYRLEMQAKRGFLDLLREQFNATVRYRERVLSWDTVIERKVVELGGFLISRSSKLDFSEPSPTLGGVDDAGLRRRMLDLSHGEAESLGIGKSTLHYLRVRAHSGKPLRLYDKVVSKLDHRSIATAT